MAGNGRKWQEMAWESATATERIPTRLHGGLSAARRENSTHDRLPLIDYLRSLLIVAPFSACGCRFVFPRSSWFKNCKYRSPVLSRGCRVRIRRRCSSLAPKGHCRNDSVCGFPGHGNSVSGGKIHLPISELS
jgi:hypothetical protein